MREKTVTVSKTEEADYEGRPISRVKLTITVTFEFRQNEWRNNGGSIDCESWGFDPDEYEQIRLRGDRLSVCGMEHFAEYASAVYGNDISAMLAGLLEEAKNFAVPV